MMIKPATLLKLIMLLVQGHNHGALEAKVKSSARLSQIQLSGGHCPGTDGLISAGYEVLAI